MTTNTMTILASIGGVAFVIALWGTFFVVRQKTAVVIERLGRFHSVKSAGLNLKIPILDKIVAVQNLKIQQLDVDIETKTKDNVFVNTKIMAIIKATNTPIPEIANIFWALRFCGVGSG